MQDLSEIREILKRDPDNAQALRAVGQYYLKEGHYKLAKNHYYQAQRVCPHLFSEIILDYEEEIEKDPEKLGVRLSLTGFRLFSGEVDCAILELEEMIELGLKNVEAYNLLGRILAKQGRMDEVILLLEHSLREGVSDVSLSENLAGAYLEKGRIKEAITFYEDILNYRPGDKKILRILGELFTRTEEYNRAAKSYQEMFSDDPEVSHEVIQRLEDLLKKLEGNVFIREILADIYRVSIKPDAAVLKLSEIVRLDATKTDSVVSKLRLILKNYPGHPSATLALAEVLKTQGNFSEAIENYYRLARAKPELIEEAMRGYQAVLEFCPNQVLARAYLAEAFLYKNQIKEALNEFKNMLEMDPSSASSVILRCRDVIKSHPQLLLARLVLGRAYLASGDFQKAVTCAEEIILVDKKFSEAYLLLGEAYSNLKLCRKAVKVLHTALLIDPFNVSVQNEYQKAKEKEIDLEISKLRERLIEDPWRISFHLDLAKLYIEKDLREEAIRQLQIAQKDQSRAPFSANLLGGIYRGEGRFDLAAAQFNKALELAPLELCDFIRTVRFNLGTCHEAQGQINKALKVYESILQEDIDFGALKKRVKYLKTTSLKSIKGKALLMVLSDPKTNRMVVLWGREGKNIKGSRKEEVSLSFGQNHNVSGFEYFMKGMYKAALEEFQLAVSLDVGFATALNNLGVSLVKEGKIAEAKIKLESAVQIEPHSVVFRNNLGLIYFMLGDFDRGSSEIEKAYTLDPENNGVCINLGDICYLKGEIRRAIDLYRRPGNFDVLTELSEKRLMYKSA
ncbi:MAG: tetratricopeptide repeat protein [Candidatus Saganbacteria bacterium]|nr:tetratricopeptide repeat protein [Candidatus Saganbacteria bacterium]